ncbi:hypothetical protein K2173_004982 [Erythroxylum novogranatense]|uniref:Clp R domain-containing protein n=1 Tax=Erythroxylum novogranatense TaxID=1862640 RepID=A0AAV8TB76_9ROSI|nr:hypothetical protein K2173_004982 [Erythroxylum novogranatense]
MPTPVITARQCLTPEAAHALDEAVNVARCRGHAQTTSLHAVSALLSLPSSILRDACARARNSAYSPRLQFKALELCLSASLERVSSSQLRNDPPVSNSLMAAIKRSQANQRRQPENFHLYQQISQQQSSSSISCIKVELQNLILSILDDPVVSRVFGEAGFRSPEIKLAIIRPLPQVFKFSRYKGPPPFLCNLSGDSDPVPGRERLSFSFQDDCDLSFLHGDENCKRISEILLRNQGRNPLLVGPSAYDALASFSELLEKRKSNLPVQLYGLSVICIGTDISKIIRESSDRRVVDLKFWEVGQFVKQSLGPGLVVNCGDLQAFVQNQINETAAYVVEELTRLLQLYGRKLWLIGAVENNETYVAFVSRFPCVEKEWDLQLLPITSSRSSMAESFPKTSLMESFVPFGGFFSTPSEMNGGLSNSCRCPPRCNLCNEKCEREVLDVSKGSFTASITDQYHSSLSPWLQLAELGTSEGLDTKTRDDGVVLSIIISGLQQKWDNICQRLHRTQPSSMNIHPPQFPLADCKKNDVQSPSSSLASRPANGPNCSCVDNGLRQIRKKKDAGQFPVLFEPKSENLFSKQVEKHSKDKLESSGLRTPHSFLMVDYSQTSSNSATSVTVELDLRISSLPVINERTTPANQKKIDPKPDVSGPFTGDTVNKNVSDHLAQSSSTSSTDLHFDLSNSKMLFKALNERIGWQDEAIHVITQTISRWRSKNENLQEASLRRDLWFTFLGPDRCGKRKIATALAEIVRGGKENLISADLNPEDGTIQTFTLFGHHDAMFRGKTVVDYVAGELSKKPLSVVFLENLDKADMQALSTLSHAIQTGKFSDSHGREVGIINTIFIICSSSTDDNVLPYGNDLSIYSEENILNAKGRPIEILVEPVYGSKIDQKLSISTTTSIGMLGSICVNKRKLVGTDQSLDNQELSDIAKRAHKMSTRNLDLNLPAEDNDKLSTNDARSDRKFLLDDFKFWLQTFSKKVHSKVIFRPFDFDALAERILKRINVSFNNIVGTECLLEIDSKVMEQLLAAAYLSEYEEILEDWIEKALKKGFVEVRRRYNPSAHTVVRLRACEAHFCEERVARGHLPTKIYIN